MEAEPAAYLKPCALDIVREFNARFIWAPDEELDALTLWQAHTWIFEACYATPRLRAWGVREDCGKSTVLKVSCVLSKNGIRTSNASLPSVYTIIEQEHPTLFFDETDQWMATGGHSQRRRELEGILNDGYTEDGYVLRQLNGVTKKWPVWVCCAYGGIGRMNKTVESRCVNLEMKPKPDNVKLEQWDPRKFGKEAAHVADMLKSWITSRGPELNPEPPIPEALGQNRAYQIWQILIAIGDLESEEWGRRARAAALKLVCGISAKPLKSPAEEFILCVAKNTNEEQFNPTSDFIQMLSFLQSAEGELPWASWLSEPLSASRQIASLLRPFGIESEQRWLDGENRRGYAMGSFHMWAARLEDKERNASTGTLTPSVEA
jgi:Protein of unknown function (DUF3631)